MGDSGPKTSGLSRGATIGMVLLGVITFLLVNGIAGIVLIALGVAMYLFNRRYLAKAKRPSAAQKPIPS